MCLALYRYVSYTYLMRIEIITSARAHGITDAEIRTVVEYPMVRVSATARQTGAQPVLFVGPAADNEPWIEVIADLADPQVALVFHAMMLRTVNAKAAGVANWPNVVYGPQRK